MDGDGIIRAHQSGKTDIYAYTVWNDTLIKSNIKSITVDESKTQKLNVEDPIIQMNPSKGIVIRSYRWRCNPFTGLTY